MEDFSIFEQAASLAENDDDSLATQKPQEGSVRGSNTDMVQQEHSGNSKPADERTTDSTTLDDSDDIRPKTVTSENSVSNDDISIEMIQSIITTVERYREVQDKNVSEEYRAMLMALLSDDANIGGNEAEVVYTLLHVNQDKKQLYSDIVEAYTKNDTDRIFYLLSLEEDALYNLLGFVLTLIPHSNSSKPVSDKKVDIVQFLYPLLGKLQEWHVEAIKDAHMLLDG